MNKQELFKKNKTALSIYERIKNNYKPLQDWGNEDLDKFLKDLKLISYNTVQTYLYTIQQLHQIECEENNIECSKLKPSEDIIEYVDLKKLRSKTIITPEEFWGIRNELVYINQEGRECNFRDVALFELAFLGLTPKEIQFLKEEDIEVLDNKLKLHLCTGRDVIVDHPQMIHDIKKTRLRDDVGNIQEQYYYKRKEYEDKEREDVLEYLYSEYLIKNINNGRCTTGEPVKHPGRMLQVQLAKIPHPKLDLAHVSIEDIRRSLTFMVLADESVDIAQVSLGKKQKTDLYWIKRIAIKLIEI